jgi:hypothetical protein
MQPKKKQNLQFAYKQLRNILLIENDSFINL